jgi:hypothetical protein
MDSAGGRVQEGYLEALRRFRQTGAAASAYRCSRDFRPGWPKHFSTQRTIISQIISPEMPAVDAVQPMISQSWQSSAK